MSKKKELKGQILVDALCRGEASLDKDLKPRWSTRPTHAPCDELETVGNITKECLLELKQMLCGEIHPCNDIGDVTNADIELVTRSQAEELSARNIAKLSRKIIALEADNKRLREALVMIARIELSFPSEFRDIARAALGEVKS